MLSKSQLPTPIQPLEDPQLQSFGVNILVKRDDLIHPTVSGTKWRKLKYNIAIAKKRRMKTLLTFGGAYSNHIFATAAAGAESGMKTIGIIRGELMKPLNPTLSYAARLGMNLQFVSRQEYRKKDQEAFLMALEGEHGSFYLIPEGGSNGLALKGVSEMINEIDVNYDFICTPVGTGGTLAGLLQGLEGKKRALGFPVLKAPSLESRIRLLLRKESGLNPSNFNLLQDYDFGGFARFTSGLIDFINRCRYEHHLRLDPIYTGKMLFGIYDLIRKGYFPTGSTVLALHTGGLQGIVGFNQRFVDLIK